MEQKLSKMIEKMVEEKTFKLDAINSINELRGNAENLEKQLEEYKEFYSRANNELAKTKKELDLWIQKENELRTKALDLDKREKNIIDLEKKAEYSELRRQDIFNLAQIVFKNPIYQETVSGTNDNGQSIYKTTTKEVRK